MVSTLAASPRTDVYSRITAEIVAAIENGAGEWRMPWHHDGGAIARPRNVASDKAYGGINISHSGSQPAAPDTRAASGAPITTGRSSAVRSAKARRRPRSCSGKQLRKSDSGDTESDAADRSDDDNSHGRARFFARGYASSTQAKSTAMHRMTCRVCQRRSASHAPMRSSPRSIFRSSQTRGRRLRA